MGNRAWFSTDKGLAYYDGDNWAVYRPSLDTHKPEMLVRDAAGKVTRSETDTAPAHNYILGVDFQGDDIWVATAKGLSHGIRIKQEKPHDHQEVLKRFPAREPIEKRPISAPESLNEAYRYARPSSFSRGLRLDLNGDRDPSHLRHGEHRP